MRNLPQRAIADLIHIYEPMEDDEEDRLKMPLLNRPWLTHLNFWFHFQWLSPIITELRSPTTVATQTTRTLIMTVNTIRCTPVPALVFL